MLHRMILLILALTLLPVTPAQEPEPEKPEQTEPREPLETRIVPVDHMAPHNVLPIIGGGVQRMMPSDELGVVSITGTKEQLDWAEAEIRKLDVYAEARQAASQKKGGGSMELHVHYIGVGVEGREIPSDSRLHSVVEQLRRSFEYEDYKLIVSYMVRAAGGDQGVRAEGVLPNLAADPEGKLGSHQSSYQLKFNFRGFAERPGQRAAILRNLEAEWTIAVPSENKYGYENASVSLSSAVDLPEGKLVVLGKAGLPGQDKGIFLVLEARPVD